MITLLCSTICDDAPKRDDIYTKSRVIDPLSADELASTGSVEESSATVDNDLRHHD